MMDTYVGGSTADNHKVLGWSELLRRTIAWDSEYAGYPVQITGFVVALGLKIRSAYGPAIDY